MQIIDLRSDTVTKPTPEMRRFMAEAEVGDDVFGEDVTVNRLQAKVASLLGKDAALFVPSGTMGNEISVKAHTRPGDEVICEYGCHIYNYESGAAAFLSGVQLRPIHGEYGVIMPEQVEGAIQPPQDHFPRTSLITIENTHNSAGGTIFPIEVLQQLYELSRARGLKLHLDGARIWNAAAASGRSVAEYATYCDSISVCFSKGLGAPVGSAVAGTRAFITEAHRLRRVYGGGMRQVGIVAAGALFALERNLDRLSEDHRHARTLAEGLSGLPGIAVDLKSVQTNIVILDVTKTRREVGDLVGALQREGILVVPFGRARLRMVTHLHITSEDIQRTLSAFETVLGAA